MITRPADPDPRPIVVTIDAGVDAECQDRPSPGEIRSGAEDHPPRLDLTWPTGTVRLEVAEDLTADQVRTLLSHLRPEVREWLDEIADYAHELEMREASRG